MPKRIGSMTVSGLVVALAVLLLRRPSASADIRVKRESAESGMIGEPDHEAAWNLWDISVSLALGARRCGRAGRGAAESRSPERTRVLAA